MQDTVTALKFNNIFLHLYFQLVKWTLQKKLNEELQIFKKKICENLRSEKRTCRQSKPHVTFMHHLCGNLKKNGFFNRLEAYDRNANFRIAEKLDQDFHMTLTNNDTNWNVNSRYHIPWFDYWHNA